MTKLECIREILTSKLFFINWFYNPIFYISLISISFTLHIQILNVVVILINAYIDGDKITLLYVYEKFELVKAIFIVLLLLTVPVFIYNLLRSFISCWDILYPRHSEKEQMLQMTFYEHIGIPLYYHYNNKLDILVGHELCYKLWAPMPATQKITPSIEKYTKLQKEITEYTVSFEDSTHIMKRRFLVNSNLVTKGKLF